ncbi:MAG: NADH-quinone oxidoreductase subunit H [Rikenellaceae bacterium]|nr:NADH-quinone oxidoreductase subunit H [Rikenellaceae bacterium]
MTGAVCIAILVAAGAAMPGVINRVRAWLAGRRGVAFFQHLYNLRAMLRKGVVTGHTATLIFRAAPSVYLAAVLTSLLFIPVGGLRPLLSFSGDVVLFAYLLALSRIALILAALDTGSSFEGMGASREALYGAMVEPALFIVAGTVALVSGYTSFASIFPALAARGLTVEMAIVLLLLVYVMVKVVTVECGRIPVDDPRTHLELTMIHEVMVLDYSGVDLAMITAAGWLKMAVLSAVAGNIAAAVTGGGAVAVVLWILLIAAAIATVESFVARNKLSRNTTYILTIVAIAFVLFLVAFLLESDITVT